MLNGWQRIWVILSAIFLILLVGILFGKIPTEDDIYKSWSYDLIELSLTLKEFQGLHIWDVRNKYKDLTNQEIIKRVQSKFSDTESGTAESGQTADSGQTARTYLSGETLEQFKQTSRAVGFSEAEINDYLEFTKSVTTPPTESVTTPPTESVTTNNTLSSEQLVRIRQKLLAIGASENEVDTFLIGKMLGNQHPQEKEVEPLELSPEERRVLAQHEQPARGRLELLELSPEEQQYTLDFTEINNEHNSRLNNLTNAQVTTISMHFGIWLAIIVCLYVFGWSIGWVIRGFKNKNS